MDRQIRPRGTLSVRRIPLLQRPSVQTVADALQASGVGFTRGAVRAFRKANRRDHFERSLDDMAKFEAGRLPLLGQLWLAKISPRGLEDFGLVSCRVVTTAGVNFIVDAFQGLVEPETMRFHGVGTGAGSEAVGNTALTTELTTQYSPSNTRPQGTLGEQSGAANVFETSATITVAASVNLTEHGIFNQAATGGGVLLDRSVFASVGLASGEALQATYRLTVPNGG